MRFIKVIFSGVVAIITVAIGVAAMILAPIFLSIAGVILITAFVGILIYAGLTEEKT